MILCIPLRQELMPRQNIFDLFCQDQEMRIQAREDNVCPDFIVQYYRIFLINEKFQAPCKRTQHCWVFHFTSVCRPRLLHVVESNCTVCTPLQNADATTRNSVVIIVGATMLGSVLLPFAGNFRNCSFSIRRWSGYCIEVFNGDNGSSIEK